MPLGWGTTFRELRVLSKVASRFQILDLEVLDTILKKNVNKYQISKRRAAQFRAKRGAWQLPIIFLSLICEKNVDKNYLTHLFKDDVLNMFAVFKQGFSRGAASGGSVFLKNATSLIVLSILANFLCLSSRGSAGVLPPAGQISEKWYILFLQYFFPKFFCNIQAAC